MFGNHSEMIIVSSGKVMKNYKKTFLKEIV